MDLGGAENSTGKQDIHKSSPRTRRGSHAGCWGRVTAPRDPGASGKMPVPSDPPRAGSSASSLTTPISVSICFLIAFILFIKAIVPIVEYLENQVSANFVKSMQKKTVNFPQSPSVHLLVSPLSVCMCTSLPGTHDRGQRSVCTWPPRLPWCLPRGCALCDDRRPGAFPRASQHHRCLSRSPCGADPTAQPSGRGHSSQPSSQWPPHPLWGPSLLLQVRPSWGSRDTAGLCPSVVAHGSRAAFLHASPWSGFCPWVQDKLS